MKHHLLPLAAALALVGCRKSEAEKPDLGYDYFPRKVGAWIEYQVDSLWRDDPAGVLFTASYRLREKVVELYIDPAGRTAWRIHRLVGDADGNWTVRDVWTSTRDERAAEVSEENLRRLKLAFPVREARRWDVNVYNPEPALEVAFREVGRPLSLGALGFEETVLVRNTVPANPIITNNYEERWAKGVGMVSRYREFKNQQANGCNQCWRLDLRAVAYGTD